MSDYVIDSEDEDAPTAPLSTVTGISASKGFSPAETLVPASPAPGTPLAPVKAPPTKGTPAPSDVAKDDGGSAGGGDEGGDCKVSSILVKEQAKECKMLFVPDGYRLSSAKIDSLIVQWGLEEKKPGTLISCDAGTVHPNSFASLELAKLATFDVFWQDALAHAKRTGKTEGDALEAFALGVINNVIFLKLCTIFTSIIDAAAIAKNWIVIDRVNSKSPASDLLIEAALAKTSNRPIIIVVDSLKRLQNFRGPTGTESIALSRNCLLCLHCRPVSWYPCVRTLSWLRQCAMRIRASSKNMLAHTMMGRSFVRVACALCRQRQAQGGDKQVYRFAREREEDRHSSRRGRSYSVCAREPVLRHR